MCSAGLSCAHHTDKTAVSACAPKQTREPFPRKGLSHRQYICVCNKKQDTICLSHGETLWLWLHHRIVCTSTPHNYFSGCSWHGLRSGGVPVNTFGSRHWLAQGPRYTESISRKSRPTTHTAWGHCYLDASGIHACTNTPRGGWISKRSPPTLGICPVWFCGVGGAQTDRHGRQTR